MADLIELDLVVRDKGLKASVSTVERLERQIIKAQKAVDQNTISQARYNKILLAAKRDYQALGMSSQKATAQVRAFAAANKQAQVATVAQTGALKSATVATNKLNAAQAQTKNKMNGNNMAIQQLGYQFGDFAVQVQGGTSAFVAFSQQGAQLAGILPMIAGPLGLSMGAAVGLSAALGVLIPVGSAIARMFFEMGGSAENAEDALEDLTSALKDYEDATKMGLLSTKELRDEFGSLAKEMKNLQGFFENVAVSRVMDLLKTDTGLFNKELSEASSRIITLTARAKALEDVEVSDIFTSEQVKSSKEAAEIMIGKIQSLSSELGLLPEQVLLLDKSLNSVLSADGMGEIGKRAVEALKNIEGMGFAAKDVPPEIIKLVNNLKQVAGAAGRATDASSKMGDEIANSMDKAAEASAEVNKETSRLLKLAKLETDVVNNV